METFAKSNSLKKFVLVWFQLFCIALLIFMAVLQFDDYRSNQDSSSVTYKRFLDENEDVHLTFSVCLHGDKGEIFKNSVRCPDPCTNQTYYEENDGECEDECQYDEYFKLISGIDLDSPITNSDSYEEKVVDFQSVLLDFYSVTKERRTIRKFDPMNKDSFLNVFSPSYQDPWNVCFTRKDNPDNKSPLQYDYLELKDGNNYLSLANYEYYIYIHQKGQLIRRLGAPNHVIKKKEGKQNKNQQKAKKKMKKGKDDQVDDIVNGYSNEISLRVKSAEVLKKRPDAINPCDEALNDEDSKWINTVINQLGCTPTFMKSYDQTKTLTSCRKEQYANYTMNYNPEYYFSKIGNLYLQPCLSMSYDIRTTHEKVLNGEILLPNLNETSMKSEMEEPGISEAYPEKDTSNEIGSIEKNEDIEDCKEKCKDENKLIEKKEDKKDCKKKCKEEKQNGKLEPTTEVSKSETVPNRVNCSDLSNEVPNCFIKVKIRVEYVAEDYKETHNYRAFGFLSLLSQIGGCIGMFLGYSLLHVPDLIEFLLNWILLTFCVKRYKSNQTFPEKVKRKDVLEYSTQGKNSAPETMNKNDMGEYNQRIASMHQEIMDARKHIDDQIKKFYNSSS